MKGIVLTRFGAPEKVLELKTFPDPPPPGPGEVVVRVTKRVVHPANLSMIRGHFNPPLPAVSWSREPTAWASSKPWAKGWTPHRA
jgi:NADPH:quinone reductase